VNIAALADNALEGRDLHIVGLCDGVVSSSRGPILGVEIRDDLIFFKLAWWAKREIHPEDEVDIVDWEHVGSFGHEVSFNIRLIEQLRQWSGGTFVFYHPEFGIIRILKLGHGVDRPNIDEIREHEIRPSFDESSTEVQLSV